MATYNAHPSVNTGDLWSATQQITFVKGNFDFIAENNIVRLFPDMPAYPPLSGISAAGIEVVETSTTDTIKPLVHRIRFDPSTDEGRIFDFMADYHMGSFATLRGLYEMSATDSGGNAVLKCQIAAVSDGDSVASKSFAAVNSVTEAVPDEANEIDEFTITLSSADGVVAGDHVSVVLWRDGNDGSDTALGDLMVRSLELRWDFTT